VGVEGGAEQVADRIVELPHPIPPLPDPAERRLHEVLGLVAVTGDGEQGPEEPPLVGDVEALERRHGGAPDQGR
jgi:hypothetical protein